MKSADDKEARFAEAAASVPYTTEEQDLIDVALKDGLQNMTIPDHPQTKATLPTERPLLNVDMIGRSPFKTVVGRQGALLSIGLEIHNSLSAIIASSTERLEALAQPGDRTSPRKRAIAMLQQCIDTRFK